jgi:serine/threonine protein kinase
MTDAANAIQPGEKIGPYDVVRVFPGRGGMAQVCEVVVRRKYWKPGSPRRLALKVADKKYESALVAETDYLRRLRHPNVVRIYPLPGVHREVYAAKQQFTFGWRWYYAMELLDGGALDGHLTRTTLMSLALRSAHTPRQPLTVIEATGIARQVAEALEHIHRQSVINLDVKPANILFRQRSFGFLRSSIPQAVLSDFGIARDPRYPRLGQLGFATPEYVSPEHAREIAGMDSTPDWRSDIFSLGVVFYEMLTGVLPFDNVGQTMKPDYLPPLPREIRPSIPAEMEEIVMRALEKEPRRRYQSAGQMKAALDALQPRWDWPAALRRATFTFMLTGMLAGGAYGLWGLDRPSTTPTRSTRTPTPTLVTPDPLSPTPSATTEAAGEGGASATSTPRPTSTPTPTPRPPTRTPTLNPIPTYLTLTPPGESGVDRTRRSK